MPSYAASLRRSHRGRSSSAALDRASGDRGLSKAELAHRVETARQIPQPGSTVPVVRPELTAAVEAIVA